MRKKDNNVRVKNAANINSPYVDRKDMTPVIIILSIALVLFLACIGLFAWNIVRMRNLESDYVKTRGTVIDIESHFSTDRHVTYYFYVIAYTFDGKEYRFTDNVGRRSDINVIGKYTEIYVNPKHPDQAVRVVSSGSVSIGYSACFCFFCFCYAGGMLLWQSKIGTSFKRRFMFIWGIEILLGITLFLLPWIWFPNSGFGEVFARIDGSIGMIVVCGLVTLATVADGVITFAVRLHKLR